MQTIFADVGATASLRQMLALRLVCKAFRVALSSEFNGPVKIVLKRQNARKRQMQSDSSSTDGLLLLGDDETDEADLSALCKILPRLTDVEIVTARQHVSLQALRECTRISMHYWDPDCVEEISGLEPKKSDKYGRVELAHLSSQLLEVDLENVKWDTASAQSLSCTGLRKLRLYWAKSHPAEICDLLKTLPSLEVSP